MIWETNEVVLLIALIAIYWVATELGFWLGRRQDKTFDESDKSHIGTLQSALLGLLALLLGFSFAMAVSRFDMRKSLLLQEVNAIGTTYLRAGFLPVEQEAETRKLLRDYVDARLDFANQDIDAKRLEQMYASAGDTHERLWTIATAAVAQDRQSESTALFITSLNEMIDLAEARRTAFDNHVPEAVVALLVVVSFGAFAYIGFSCGLARRRRLPSTISFIVLSAMVLVIILDMDRPRRGLILVKQEPMLRLQASLDKDAP